MNKEKARKYHKKDRLDFCEQVEYNFFIGCWGI